MAAEKKFKARRTRTGKRGLSDTSSGMASKVSLVEGGSFHGMRWRRLYHDVSEKDADAIVRAHKNYVKAVRELGVRVRPFQVKVHRGKGNLKRVHYFFPNIPEENMATRYFKSKKVADEEAVEVFRKIVGSVLGGFFKKHGKEKRRVALDASLLNWAVENGEPVYFDTFPSFISRHKGIMGAREIIRQAYPGSIYPQKGWKKILGKAFMGIAYASVMSPQTLTVLMRQAERLRPSCKKQFINTAKKEIDTVVPRGKRAYWKLFLTKGMQALDKKRVNAQVWAHEKLKTEKGKAKIA